jgi:transposase
MLFAERAESRRVTPEEVERDARETRRLRARLRHLKDSRAPLSNWERQFTRAMIRSYYNYLPAHVKKIKQLLMKHSYYLPRE